MHHSIQEMDFGLIKFHGNANRRVMLFTGNLQLEHERIYFREVLDLISALNQLNVQ